MFTFGSTHINIHDNFSALSQESHKICDLSTFDVKRHRSLKRNIQTAASANTWAINCNLFACSPTNSQSADFLSLGSKLSVSQSMCSH